MTFKLDEKTKKCSIPMTSGKTFCLDDYRGKTLVLYFYPKDSTPDCTSESIDFSQNAAEFAACDAVIFGISKDTLASHEKFKAKYHMPFELVADNEKTLCEAFHVLKEKSMFGKPYLGIERSTFVIDKNGDVVQAWRKVKVPGHVQEVLTFIQSL